MKILWLTAADENAFGHSELFGLADSLIKTGHEVTVLLASKDRQGRHGHLQYIKNRFGRLLFFKLKLAMYVAWRASFDRPDFIIVDWESAFVPAILVLLSRAGLYNVNLVHDIRTIPVPTTSNHARRIFDLCIRISKKYYLGLTTITDGLKHKLCLEYGIPAEKIGVWSSGVDLNLFRPLDGSRQRKELGLDGKFVVFYHGSVGNGRGVVEVVEAFALLKEQYSDIRFFILGSGAEMETVLKLKAAKHLDNVLVFPPVTYERVPEFIAVSDVCIVPLPDLECWRVSSPLKLMEYLAMGKPVILTDIPAHREIVKNSDEALFVPNIQPHTLRSVITEAYRLRKRLPEIGGAGLCNARENYSWDVQANRLINFLESLRSQDQGQLTALATANPD